MRLYDYAASGNCFKVRLLFGMLGIEYDRVPIDIFAGDTLTCEYAMINPLRETPVLELDGGERLGQSNAILWYLGEGTEFLPDGRLERAQVAQWLSFELTARDGRARRSAVPAADRTRDARGARAAARDRSRRARCARRAPRGA